MKKIISSLVVMLLYHTSKAQFTSGSQFHIPAQTLVTIDGLALRPSTADFTLRYKTISVKSKSVAGKSGNSINRVYDFNEPVKFTGEAGIVYASDELNQNNESVLQLAYADNQGVYHTTPDSKVNLAEHFVSRDFNAENLLKITAVDASVVLPVKLVDFSAKKQERSTILKWSTSEEVSSDYFEVQRSQDGKQWSVLAKVNTQGESHSLQEYTFTDPRPAAGENIYRLKMVDTDGSSAFSKLATLHFSEGATVNVYPNPVSQLLHVQVPENEELDFVKINNLAGQIVCRSREKDIRLGALPAGTYVVEIRLKSGIVTTSKIVRN